MTLPTARLEPRPRPGSPKTVAFLLVLLASGARTARADEAAAPVPPPVPKPAACVAPATVCPAVPVERPTVWYGWQTLIADGAAVTLTVAATGSNRSSDVLAAAALGTYLFAAPAVHAAHGRGGSAAASLGLRVAAPLLGAVTGYALFRGDGDWGGAIGAVLGTGGGILAASAVDAAVLARKPSEETTVRPAEEPQENARITPAVAVTPRGATFGAIGTF